jgi:hypothetical protein
MTAQTHKNQKDAVEEVMAQKYFIFICDLYKKTKNGFKSIMLTDISKKEGVPVTAAQILCDMKVMNKSGNKRGAMYHWRSDSHPSMELAKTVRKKVLEHQASNRGKDKKTNPPKTINVDGRRLIPIIKERSAGFYLESLTKLKAYCDGGTLVPADIIDKEYGIGEDHLNVLVQLGYIKESAMAKGMFQWSSLIPPNMELAEVMISEVKEIVKKREQQEDASIEKIDLRQLKHEASIAKVLEFIKFLHGALKEPTRIGLQSECARFGILLNATKTIKDMNLVEFSGSRRYPSYKWIGPEPTEELATKIQAETYKAHSKYIKVEKEVIPEPEITQAVLPVQELESGSTGSFYDNLCVEEQRLVKLLDAVRLLKNTYCGIKP